MLNRNKYTKIPIEASVLLVEDLQTTGRLTADGYRIVLHDDTLLIARDNDFAVE